MAIKLRRGVDSRFAQLQRWARDFSVPFTVTSATRTSAKQQQLYEAWLARGKTGLPAAPPGTSTHEYGLAVDLVPGRSEDLPFLVEIAKCAGFVWAGQSDPVHFDVFGNAEWRRVLSGMGASPASFGTGC